MNKTRIKTRRQPDRNPERKESGAGTGGPRASCDPISGTLKRRLLDSTALNWCQWGGGVALAAGIVAGLLAQPAWANPEGGVVAGGGATISTAGTQLTVHQQTDQAIINWQSFSIGSNEVTRFEQPGAGSIALNRVVGGARSDISGLLQANGNVWIVNPAGVLVNAGGRVDVSGFLATTADIRDADFLNRRFEFSKPSPDQDATVVNRGTISVGERGLAGLVAPGVGNAGLISGRMAQVVLAGAPTFTVDFSGDGLVRFDATSKVTKRPDGVTALVTNDGVISAPGGTVMLTANAAAGIIDDVINSKGVIAAQAIAVQGGDVILSGGDSGIVTVEGTIDVSGAAAGQTGGTVTVTGQKVGVLAGARIDASGSAGGGEVRIGGDFQGGHASAEKLAQFNVRPARKPVPNAKVTVIAAGAVINADATLYGSAGQVIVWADDQTYFEGTIEARGGLNGGDGGFVEVSGKQTLSFRGGVDTTARHGTAGTTLLDPRDITITSAGADDAGLSATGILFNDAGIDTNTDATFTPGAIGALTGAVVIQASRDFFVNDAVTFTAATTVSLEAGRNMSVAATIDSTGTIPITLLAGQAFDANGDAAGSITTTAALGSATTGDLVLTSGTGGISLGGNVTSVGTVTFNNVVTLAADTIVDTAGAATSGAVHFVAAVDSDATPRSLTLRTGSYTATFDDAVGGVSPLATVQVGDGSAAGHAAFTPGGGLTTLAVGATALNVDATSAGSTATLNGLLTATATVGVTAGANAAQLTLNGEGANALVAATLNEAGGGTATLVVSGAADQTVSGTIDGSAAGLGRLQVLNGANTASFSGAVGTTRLALVQIGTGSAAGHAAFTPGGGLTTLAVGATALNVDATSAGSTATLNGLLTATGTVGVTAGANAAQLTLNGEGANALVAATL
ncbi:MAG: filamentous hemagglutinin N-terminal domain-containing protein, partial [Azospirillum sp.]|nr:filamentous hemagglutinin N-terminal domain-containing protein [Azospirillum sp.]